MKTFLPIGLMAIMLSTTILNAKAAVHRVGYPGPGVGGVDYGDLQSAHDNSNPGDTIYLYPGGWSATFRKQIILIGYGYFLNTNKIQYFNWSGLPNPNLSIITQDMSVNVDLGQGSDGSVLEGLQNLTVNYNQCCYSGGYSTGNIKIDRCTAVVNFTSPQDGPAKYDYWLITRSFVNIVTNNYYGESLITNLSVNNCCIGNLDLSQSGNGVQESGAFANDVFGNVASGFTSGDHFNGGTFIVQNCIFAGYADGDANVIYFNNLTNSDANNWMAAGTGTGTGNITASFSAKQVWVDYPTANQGINAAGKYSSDAGFALTANSPAKGMGVGGIDMGIYGGTNPYLLSGIPPVPTFYKLTANGVNASSSPYTVTFSVRSNK